MAEQQKSPAELAAELEAKKKAMEARDKFLNDVRTAVNSTQADPNVRLVLRYVRILSGFEMNPVTIGANGDVMVNATVYNAGRESLYHDLRKSMSADTKNVVERSE